MLRDFYELGNFRTSEKGMKNGVGRTSLKFPLAAGSLKLLI